MRGLPWLAMCASGVAKTRVGGVLENLRPCKYCWRSGGVGVVGDLAESGCSEAMMLRTVVDAIGVWVPRWLGSV